MRWQDYLAQERPPFDFVQNDCCRWIDRYVRARGHGSPMDAIEMHYTSERTALRRIAEGCGLASLWLKGMEAIGVATCSPASIAGGAVGVITRPTVCGTGEAAAIWSGERWISLGTNGLDFGPADALVTWNV